MIRLDDTDRTLKAVLAGAISSANPDVVVSYIERSNPVRPGVKTGTKVTAMNGATAVTICQAPEKLVVREIDSITLLNNDNAQVTASILYDDNGTSYTMVKVALEVSETLFYSDGTGWRVLNADGQVKE